MLTYSFLKFYFVAKELLVKAWSDTGFNLHDVYANLVSNGNI